MFVIFLAVGGVVWNTNQRLYKGLNRISWIVMIGQLATVFALIILARTSDDFLFMFYISRIMLYGAAASLGFIIPGSILRTKLNKAYSDKGYLKDWYDKTRVYLIKNNWTEKMIDSITKSKVVHLHKIKEPKQSIIYSIGSNRGETEKEIYLLLKEKYNVKMICTDAYYEDVTNKTKTFEDFIYLEGNRPGEDIEDILSEILVRNVDVIIDKKACLWYSKKVNLEDVFRKYHRSLSLNGVIIIDAEEISFLRTQLNNLFYQLANRIVGSAERSTYSKIKNTISKSSFINEHYSCHFVGHGVYRTAIFRKVK